MTRAITADQILFNECIGAFRREQKIKDEIKVESKSFLLSSFRINENWDLGICRVSQSQEIKLTDKYSGFISIVSNPDSVGKHNPHLYGIALSAIISFITLKNCKSTRDDYLCMREAISPQDFFELAIMNPILTKGPGANNIHLSNEQLLYQEIKKFINILHNIEYSKYIKLMQSIRMINLSILYKKDDFGLAYFLAVSAIETIAQIAIDRDAVKNKDDLETIWKEKATDDPILEKLYDSYKKLRGNNSYLSERYVRFITVYAPQAKWIDLVPDPEEDTKKDLKQLSKIMQIKYKYDQIIAEKRSFQVYPEDLNDSQIKEILGNSYKYRSEFVHQGKQPPHREVNGQKRFFEKFGDYFNSIKDNKHLLPTYDLIINIAKYSIINWAENNKKNKLR
jgi:hypothetical protein